MSGWETGQGGPVCARRPGTFTPSSSLPQPTRQSRKNLALAATWIVIASQRAAEWGDARRADAVARWSVAWLWLFVGWLGDAAEPAPVLDQLLSRGELDALAKARKPRALAFRTLCGLMGGIGAGAADFMMDKLGETVALLEATKRQAIPSGGVCVCV